MNKIFLIAIYIISIVPAQSQVLGDSHAIIYSMDLCPEDHLLAAMTDKKHMVIFDYRTQKKISEWTSAADCNSIAMEPGKIIMAGSDGSITVISTRTFKADIKQHLSDQPFELISISGSDQIFVTDKSGNVYRSGPASDLSVFRILCSESNGIIAITELNDSMIVVVSRDKLFSLMDSKTGKLISKQKLSDHDCIGLERGPLPGRITAVFRNGQVIVYSLKPQINNLVVNSKYKPGAWPVALDCLNGIIIAGTTSGKINLYATFTGYKRKIPFMVNYVKIIPDDLPYVKVAAGTMGGGIRIIEFKNKKINQ